MNIADENKNVKAEEISIEPSALPSGIAHTFDTGYAIAYGVDEAIMIRNFQFFIISNANRGQNFHEGRYWTYDRLEDFTKHFPYWTIKQVRRIIASLVKQNVIIKGEFNEVWSLRTQWYAFKDQDSFIKNITPPKEPLPPASHSTNRESDRCPNGQLPSDHLGICSYTSNISSSISSNTSYMVPPESASQESTIVDDVSFVSPSKSKKEKAPPAFSAEVKEMTAKMIAICRKCSPVYRAPDKLDKFHEQVALLLEKDEQDPKLLLKAFEWACSDSVQRGEFKGWQGIICSNKKKGKPSTPAENFRHHYDNIHAQMISQPVRKFAPSSNDQRALDALRAAKKDAI